MPSCPSPPAGLGKTLIRVAYLACSLCVQDNLSHRLKALCFAEISEVIICELPLLFLFICLKMFHLTIVYINYQAMTMCQLFLLIFKKIF